ncbi:MAG: hypothetical protein F4X85_08710 [Acidimicrobiaceae bacterium]|nr:hypothetical protein [Acidimicrobiaceae bacterium]
MVTGAGLPSMYGLLGEARSHAERLFAFVSMDSLSAGAASEALARPAVAAGVQWEEPALSEVFDATHGYPYFLQEYGKQTWRLAEGPERITRDDVTAARPHVTEQLDDGFFSVRVGRTTKAEREYLKAMASLGRGPYRSGAVARELHKSTRQVSTIRDSLIKRGLCFAPEHDVIDFTVPMFDAFARHKL